VTLLRALQSEAAAALCRASLAPTSATPTPASPGPPTSRSATERPSSSAWGASPFLAAGDLDAYTHDLERSSVLCNEVGITSDIVATRFFAARGHILRGEADRDIDYYQAGLRVTRSEDPEVYTPAVLALASAIDGEADRAADHPADLPITHPRAPAAPHPGVAHRRDGLGGPGLGDLGPRVAPHVRPNGFEPRLSPLGPGEPPRPAPHSVPPAPVDNDRHDKPPRRTGARGNRCRKRMSGASRMAASVVGQGVEACRTGTTRCSRCFSARSRSIRWPDAEAFGRRRSWGGRTPRWRA
jgi:hypothetical protein